MPRITTLALVSIVLGAVSGPLPGNAPQMPRIDNGRVESRPATRVADAIAGVGASTDPVWLAWRVPMAPGDRDACATYVTSEVVWHGAFLEGGIENLASAPPAAPAPATGTSTPVALEQGTGLVVLVRVVDREIERIRAFGDDCQLDAGGRVVHWLTGMTPAESLSFLEGVIGSVAVTPSVQYQHAASAISAISLHDGAAAEAILDRVATSHTELSMRRTAIRQLARERGARGFERVRQLLSTESSADERVALVEAIALTRQPQTADTLLGVARSDAPSSVRRTAAYWYPQRAGTAGVDATLAIIRNDTDEDVKARALAGLTKLPADITVPHLIELVRTSSSQRVRRESVAALGRTRDPRAIEFLASLIRSAS